MRNVLRRRSRIRHFTEVEFGTAGKSVENLEDRRLLSVVSIPSYDILTSRNFSYASQDSLRVRLTAEAEEQYDDFFGTNAEKPEQYIVDGHSVERPSGRSGTSAAEAYSVAGVNLQVGGFNEVVLIETDGVYSFTILCSELVGVRAVTATNSSPEVVSRIPLAYQPTAMFLNNGRLTIIGERRDLCTWTRIDEWGNRCAS